MCRSSFCFNEQSVRDVAGDSDLPGFRTGPSSHQGFSGKCCRTHSFSLPREQVCSRAVLRTNSPVSPAAGRSPRGVWTRHGAVAMADQGKGRAITSLWLLVARLIRQSGGTKGTSAPPLVELVTLALTHMGCHATFRSRQPCHYGISSEPHYAWSPGGWPLVNLF